MPVKKRVWTEAKAISFLKSRGMDVSNKVVHLNGQCGLTGGSALDYLIGCCGYLVAVTRSHVPKAYPK
jgi:hypothetical protein